MNLNKRVGFFVILISFICSAKNTAQSISLDDSIPDSIIQKSDDYVISKVGERFFESFMILDTMKSKFRKSFRIAGKSLCAETIKNPHYFFCYNIQIPDKGVDLLSIEFIMDTNGDIIPKCYNAYIPHCPDNNCWNYFPRISKAEAILIAKNSGFEQGLKNWLITFHYYGHDYNNYVWGVKNYLSLSSPIDKEKITSGEIIYINATDGSIVSKEQWAAIP